VTALPRPRIYFLRDSFFYSRRLWQRNPPQAEARRSVKRAEPKTREDLSYLIDDPVFWRLLMVRLSAALTLPMTLRFLKTCKRSFISRRRPLLPDWRHTVIRRQGQSIDAAQKAVGFSRQEREYWSSIGEFIRTNGGWVTSIPDVPKMTFECMSGSELPALLARRGFAVLPAGTSSRLLPSTVTRGDRTVVNQGAIPTVVCVYYFALFGDE
jgi:hypothetical protein